MPRLTFPFHPELIRLEVLVGPDELLARLRADAALFVPLPVPATAVLDTGTTRTAVAPHIIHHLQLPELGESSTETAQGEMSVKLYSARFLLRSDPAGTLPPLLLSDALPITDLPHPIEGVDVLLGLNAFLNLRLTIDGPAGTFTLDL